MRWWGIVGAWSIRDRVDSAARSRHQNGRGTSALQRKQSGELHLARLPLVSAMAGETASPATNRFTKILDEVVRRETSKAQVLSENGL